MKNIYRILILAPSPFLPIGEFDGVSDVPVPPDFQYDNSFGTKLSETRSVGYYSNDDVASGYMKLALNNFESVFFTYRIMKENLCPAIIKAIVISVIFILVAILGLQNIFILLIQITLPITIIVESIRHADILNQLTNYTATLTAGSVLLDDRTYSKLNASLSKEWDEIKNEFEIK